jgi:anti-sigma-K factor RskA
LLTTNGYKVLMKHEEYKEMLALYSLGALDETEKSTLDEHLATCAECRAELVQWEETASALAYMAEPAEPSTALRTRILENVGQLARQPATLKAVDLNSSSTGEGPNVADERAAQDSNVVQMPSRSWSSPEKLLAIAASLAFVALLTSLLVVWSRNKALQAEVARLSRTLYETQDKLARVEQDSEILNAPTLAMANLKGTEVAQNAQGKLMYDQKTGRAILTASNLPPAPAGKAYQLWYIAGNRALPGGVFTTDATGRATLRDQLPPEARDANAFAVTLEPASGVKAPTGEKYLLTPAT